MPQPRWFSSTSLRCRLVRRGGASAARRTRRSRCPRSFPRHHAHTTPLFLMRGLTSRARHPRWPRRTCAARCALFLLFSCSGFPPSSRPAGFLSCLWQVAPHPLASIHAPAVHCATLCATLSRARTRARTTDGERCDVRSTGVADWKTARRGNAERTLTA